MELRVNDYVRTNLGRIAKITKVIDCEEEGEKPYLNYNNMCVYTIDENFIVAGSRGEIIASSPNIIDLIEVGDCVNGMEVMDADWINENGEYEEGLAFPMYASDDLDVIENWLPLKNIKIKSIVTKEQFSQMEYRIEEE